MFYIVTHNTVDESLLRYKSNVVLHVGSSKVFNTDYLLDSTGDNISEKNPFYCELTGLYWIWKNGKENPNDVVGFEHYRRIFLNTDRSFLSDNDVNDILNEYDIITPKPFKLTESVEKHYSIWHRKEDLDVLKDLINKEYRDYSEALDNVLHRDFLYTCNIMILRKSLFDEYAKWLFSVLFSLEKKIDATKIEDLYQRRVFGFLAERLFNIWLEKNKPNKKELPVYIDLEKYYSWIDIKKNEPHLVLSNGNNVPFDNKKYDHIICVNCIETANDPVEFINKAKAKLSSKGKLYLFCNNRLGLRYFSGELDPYTNSFGDGIDNYVNKKPIGGRCYSLNEIMSFVKSSGLTNSIVYSIFPSVEDMKFIIREGYKPNEKMSIRMFPKYKNPSNLFLQEEYAIDGLIQNNLLPGMANGLLIELSNGDIEDNYNEVIISGERRSDLSFITYINKDGEVIKKPLHKEGEEHLIQRKRNEDELSAHGVKVVSSEIIVNNDKTTYISKYQNKELANSYLQRIFFEDKELFIKEMDKFKDTILKASKIIDKNGNIQEKAYPDMVPLNAFVDDKGDFIFFDQEFMVENYPADSIITRAILIVYELDQKMESVLPKKFFFDRYNLSKNLDKLLRIAKEFTDVLYKQNVEKGKRIQSDFVLNRQRLNYPEKLYEQLTYNPVAGLENKDIYLFGVGTATEKFIEMYQRDFSIKGIIAFDDTNKPKEIMSYHVYGTDIFKEICNKNYRVIICDSDINKVRAKLLECGVSNIAVYNPEKVYPGRQATTKYISSDKKKKYHIGYIAGVFDLYHIGHLNMFKRAKEMCDYLIVGVVTDKGVIDFKKTEPFIPFNERIEMVRSCSYVDEAVEIPYFYRDTKEAFEKYHFDVQFSGSDYKDNPLWLEHKAWLEERGATMVFFPYTASTSSSKIKKMINESLLEK